MATLSFPNYNFSITNNLEPTDNFNEIKLSRKKRDSCATQAQLDILAKGLDSMSSAVGKDVFGGASKLASLTGSIVGFQSPTTCDLDAKLDQILQKLHEIARDVQSLGPLVECTQIKNKYDSLLAKIQAILHLLNHFRETIEAKNETRIKIISRCNDHTEGIHQIYTMLLILLENYEVVNFLKNCARYESEKVNIWSDKVMKLASLITLLIKICEEANNYVTEFDPPRFEKEVIELIQYYSEITNLKEFVADQGVLGLRNIVKSIANNGKSADETAQTLKEKFNYFNWDVIFYSSKIHSYDQHAAYYHPDYTYCGSHFYLRELDHGKNAIVAWCIPNNNNPRNIELKGYSNHAKTYATNIYNENKNLNYVLVIHSQPDCNGYGNWHNCYTKPIEEDYNGITNSWKEGEHTDDRKFIYTSGWTDKKLWIFASWSAYKNEREKPELKNTKAIVFTKGGKNVITKYDTRLFGHYQQYTEKDDYKCFRACKSEEQCAAATFHALYNCFFFRIGFRKSVESGWTSYIKHEETDIKPANPCASVKCNYGGSCISKGSYNYTCYCRYTVNVNDGICEDPCSYHACGLKSRKCVSLTTGFRCECNGFSTNNEACSKDATCDGCANHSKCVLNRDKKYQCMIECFFGEDTVRMVDGGYQPIAKLNPGDRVWSLGVNGKMVEDEIVMIMHMEPNTTALFYTFTTIDGQSISMTAAHLIQTLIPSSLSFNMTVAFLPASKITLDHRLFVSGNNNPISIARIITIHRVGIYAPLTLSGTLLVNNISASCFIEAYGVNHEVQYNFFKLFILYYRFTRWIYGRNYHPFAAENYQDGYHPFIATIMQNRNGAGFLSDCLHTMIRPSSLIIIIVLIGFNKQLKRFQKLQHFH
ncbi:unnamed protein product [Rotaria socialis]|uniref:Uncharacterized protein n=1 Tax=Rotaria socialis TaxID=392032 RepID=A0A818IWC2_9BILA|nr:unnamed protein product [Rotaria socialis]CAF4478483.1 unnamed protein product [Rotaria socialis]